MRKIAIACSGQAGDIMTAMSVLHYKDELWGPDAEITWLADERYYDIFKYNPYLKVKQFPHGWQISEQDKNTIYTERIAKDKAEGKPDWEDLNLAKTADGKVDQTLKQNFKSIAEFDEVYFPAPWQVPANRRMGVNYPECSKKVFEVPDSYLWHPVLFFSDEERKKAEDFMTLAPSDNPNRKKVLIESFCGSGQSKITHQMIMDAMKTCEDVWGDCAFVFVSHKYLNGREEFPNEILHKPEVVFAKHFTVRQAGLLINHADLMISTSSGVTVASSHWGAKSTPILQFCGSAVCGTKELARGEMIQVFTDERPFELAEAEFKLKLIELLTKYK